MTHNEDHGQGWHIGLGYKYAVYIYRGQWKLHPIIWKNGGIQ